MFASSAFSGDAFSRKAWAIEGDFSGSGDDDVFDALAYRAHVEKAFKGVAEDFARKRAETLAFESSQEYDSNRAQVASEKRATASTEAFRASKPIQNIHQAASSQGGFAVSKTKSKRIITPRGTLEDDEAALAAFAMLMFDD